MLACYLISLLIGYCLFDICWILGIVYFIYLQFENKKCFDFKDKDTSNKFLVFYCFICLFENQLFHLLLITILLLHILHSAGLSIVYVGFLIKLSILDYCALDQHPILYFLRIILILVIFNDPVRILFPIPIISKFFFHPKIHNFGCYKFRFSKRDWDQKLNVLLANSVPEKQNNKFQLKVVYLAVHFICTLNCIWTIQSFGIYFLIVIGIEVTRIPDIYLASCLTNSLIISCEEVLVQCYENEIKKERLFDFLPLPMDLITIVNTYNSETIKRCTNRCLDGKCN